MLVPLRRIGGPVAPRQRGVEFLHGAGEPRAQDHRYHGTPSMTQIGRVVSTMRASHNNTTVPSPESTRLPSGENANVCTRGRDKPVAFPPRVVRYNHAARRNSATL